MMRHLYLCKSGHVGAHDPHLSLCSSTGEISPPTFICGKRRENRRKPVKMKILSSGVVFTFEEGISTSHVDKSGAFAPTYPPLERKSDLRSSFLRARNDLNKWLKHVKRGYKKQMKTRIKIHETKCGPPRGRSLPPSSPRRARLLPPEATAFWRKDLEDPTFEGVTETHRLRKNTSFRFPPHHGISRIAQACFLLISDTSRDFIYCATKDAKYLKAANQRLRKNTSFRFPPHHGISRIAQACFLLISDTSRDFIYCATKDAKYLKAATQSDEEIANICLMEKSTNDPSTSKEFEVNSDFEELLEAFNEMHEEAQRLVVLNKKLKSELKLYINKLASTQGKLNVLKQENEKFISRCKATACDDTSTSFNMDDYKFLQTKFENFKKHHYVECMKLQTDPSYFKNLLVLMLSSYGFKISNFNNYFESRIKFESEVSITLLMVYSAFKITTLKSFKYMMNSVITILYFNGRVYEGTDGVIFKGSKKAIQIKRAINKVKLENNEIISAISCRFLVSGKYVALQICDNENVETMIESFQQQEQMSVLEFYIEKDVAGGSMFHFANFVTSCGNNLSNNEVEPPRNVINLHGDEDDDDDDYLVSNSYVEESLDEDDSVDGISDTDDEVSDMIQPNDALHYNNINWSHPDEEDICGLEIPSSFNVGQELYVGMDFDSKDAVKSALKQYVMKVYQSFKVVESKSNNYIICCMNKSANCPCSFYMRAILSKKTYSWKVTQWGGPHTCLNMTMTQDHEKLDLDLIATCVVGMIREDPSIKVSLIQERINSEFAYKVSYKKAWMAKQKAIAIEYGDWEESYAKLSSWLTHMQNHSPGSYFQILHDDFIVGNRVSREHRQFHRVFWTFGQCKEAFKYCKPIIQVDGTHLYGKYRGTLLMATSQDGNGGILPLAFIVVEGETLIAWSWFLAHLREHVTDKNGICLISDRHTSIKSVVANEALASNFNRKFNNAKQKEMLKKLGYTPSRHIFYQNLERFHQLSPAIATWIDRISKEKWTMAYDTEGRRYGHMTTNLFECINKVLKDCRNISITALVKSTYSRCRKYFVDCGHQAQRKLNEGQVYCSKIVKELRKNQEQACSHIIRSIRFEVEETFNPITQCGGQKWAVNLNGHYCQCRKYFVLHYPCSHIIAACDVVYTNEHILKAYSAEWWSLRNEAAIPPSDDAWTLIPDPTTIHVKGRPKSTRIRNEMDWLEPSEHRQKCSRCGAEGRNRRQCQMQSDHGRGVLFGAKLVRRSHAHICIKMHITPIDLVL
ncbi:hypothetical protein HKD37_02G004397 [Glycine soja]